MASCGWPSPWRPNSSRLLTTPSLLAPMSTRISSLSIRTTLPSTTSPCLKLLMSESCSASSSSIVVGSGPSSRAGAAPPRPRWRRAHRRCRRRSSAATRSADAVAAGALGGRSAAAPRRQASSASVAARRPAASAAALAGVSASSAGALDAGPASVARRCAARRLGAVGLGSSGARCGGRRRRRRSGSRGRRGLVAGSSATATAATVSSDAWSAAEAIASGSGAVPPCCSSVKVVGLSCGGFAPENHERPERRSSRVRYVQVVRGDRLRGPLLRASSGLSVALQLSCLLGPGESSTRLSTATIARAVPELPDLTVVADALHAALAGRTVRLGRRRPDPLPCGARRPSWPALVGQRVRVHPPARQVPADRSRAGRDRRQPDADRAVPAGRARATSCRPRRRSCWASGHGPARPRDAARWTRGAPWLPADDAPAEVRYRDPTQMGKIYLQPAGVERDVPGLGGPDQGPDADDPALTLEVWRERIRRHPGELKNLLRNQSFVAGIGNAYSDEILHAAKLLPFRKRSSLAAEEVDALYAATRTTLADAIDVLRERVPADVRDARSATSWPSTTRADSRARAAAPGSPRSAPAASSPSYCRGCQH